MTAKLDTSDPTIKEQMKRIVVRLQGQGKPEIMHVLNLLFPNAKALGLQAIAEDLSDKRDNSLIEFTNMVETYETAMEYWDLLSGNKQNATLLSIRSSFDPTKFELKLTCARTPLKEFFSECRSITCESCIEGRIKNISFEGENPWSLELKRTEHRRVDLCKNCGNLLSDRDQITMRNERMIYICHYCNHRGWNPAK